MSEKNGAVLMLVTAATRDEAENLGEGLLGAGLATRGSVIPGVHSFWLQGGKLERGHEALLMITTTAAQATAATRYIRENHSFEEPTVIPLRFAE